MPLVTEEQKERQESSFLKYEAENNLIIESNLYRISSHYLPKANKFVACHKADCFYCAHGVQKKIEYNYMVNLNGNKGMIDIKPSVFFAINAIEKASGKDKRNISWLVIKSGSGLKTEYTVSKDDNLSDEDIKVAKEKLESNNEKLSTIMVAREKRLEDEYKLHIPKATEEEIEKEEIHDEPEDRNDDSGKDENILDDDLPDEVNPYDIPF